MERRSTSGGGATDEATGLERGDDARCDVIERADAVDRVDDPLLAVRREDRGGLPLVDVEPSGDRCLGVIRATLLRCAELEALEALLAGDGELDHGIQRVAT